MIASFQNARSAEHHSAALIRHYRSSELQYAGERTYPAPGKGTSMHAPTTAAARKLFEGHSLFGILSAEDVDALLLHARFERYPAGRLIFARGSPGRSMMAVLGGGVRISTTSPSGREAVLAILNAGEIFGELALLDGGERTADAVAVSDCDLLVIDQRDFIPFLENRADLCIGLLKLLSQRLRRTDELVEVALFERLESRLAKALVELASGGGVAVSEAGPPFVLRVSQQEMGSIVGASRENVNKQLRAWQRAGLLELGKRRIVIRNLDALEGLG
jgi:CRP/FNR family cyclic AMP-dependent transcriptional regulator